ncbi:MAG: translation initiation factor IF-2 [Candidatus Marinimicrobia bacterium]|nr:translation initiation factor IF-2 [Candidatus Neomarinimicrobiota bacterium]
MAKTRIFQIAKDLNISHTEIISFLKSKDIKILSHMSPVDEKTYQVILEEFSKEKEVVDRYRKEQVRKEIHDTRLKERQSKGQKLELLSLEKQRMLEKEERLKKKKLDKKISPKEKNGPKEDIKKELTDKEDAAASKNKKLNSSSIAQKDETDSKIKGINKKFKRNRKLRTIDIKNIQSEISKGTIRTTDTNKTKSTTAASAPKSVKNKVKGILAKMETKTKKKTYKKSKKIDEKPTDDVEKKPDIQIAEFSSVEELSKILEVTPSEIIQTCIELGMLVTKNQRLDWDLIELLADNYGFLAEKISNAGDDLLSFDDSEDDLKNAKPRTAIVTVMGHVDHGKTSLLDYIRDTNVASGESGGITQHIGAYKVMYNKSTLTFLDTPGHEAFTAMRARGAQVTDIVVLVVSADDSVMPQTIEAINHTKAAEVPMIIAINKMDRPGADAEKVRRELSDQDVLTESWGGKIQDVEISAKTGLGIDELMDSLLLEAEILDLKANKDCNAMGTIIDSRLDRGLGPVGTVLVQKGTLKIGDPFICNDFSGKVKSIVNDNGVKLDNAFPSDAVQIQGFEQVPQAADVFAVVDDEKSLKRISSDRQRISREIDQKKISFSLDHMSSLIKEGNIKILPVIIKGDVDGSLEALAETLEKLNNKEVAIRVIHKAVGMITESDVLLAEASKAVIIGFHVQVTSNARLQAKQAGVDIRNYTVIYNAVEELKMALEGLLDPDMIESSLGKAEVLTQFKIPKIGFIAGCKVVEGFVIRNSKARIVRDGEVIFEGLVNSLKRHKDDAREVKEGLECGIGVDGIKKFNEGDIIEIYEIKEVKRSLG